MFKYKRTIFENDLQQAVTTPSTDAERKDFRATGAATHTEMVQI